jgi:hypothetical protein
LVSASNDPSAAPPFILTTDGVRFFQEFPQLSPQFVNNTGVVVGHGTLSGQGGIFRARIDGSGYSELTYAFPLVVSIAQLTDVGVALFQVHATSPGGRRFYMGTFLWDGSSHVPVSSTYGLPGTAVPTSVGEDGLIGGAWNSQPFLKLPDGDVMLPWSGGHVQKIGPGGHVVGHDEAWRLIVRRPDGSLRPSMNWPARSTCRTSTARETSSAHSPIQLVCALRRSSSGTTRSTT